MREPFTPNLAELPPPDEEECRLVLKPVCAADWQGKAIPERQWSWHHWLPKGTVAGLSGPPGVAKSLLTQQICTHKALGGQLLGSNIPLGAALYITCEDEQDELMRRQARINTALGIQMNDVPDLFVDSWLGLDARLLTYSMGSLIRTPRFNALDELIGDLKAEIVGLDLLADMWDGNECDRQAVNQFVKANLAYLAQRHHSTILGVYHPSMSGINSGTGESGSTAWSGSFRSRLYLKPEENSDTRILTRMKSNYAAIGDEHRLVWMDGYLAPESSMKKSELEKRSEDHVAAFLECLQTSDARGKEISPTNSAANYYGKVFPNMWQMMDGRHKKITQKQFENAYLKAEFEGAVEVVPATSRRGKRLKFTGYKRD